MKPVTAARDMTRAQKAAYIDFSILKPEFTTEDVVRLAEEGIEEGCATLCVNPWALDIVAPMVAGTPTGVCVVCDFPFGQGAPADKERLARSYATRSDVDELDLVINYGLLREGGWKRAGDEIAPAIAACHEHSVTVKVILETDALTPDQVSWGIEAVIRAGGDFVKTSTGFYTGGPARGAARDVVAHILARVDGRAKVKGSGNIRDKDHFLDLIDMGIDRMGVGYRSVPVVLAG